MVKFVGGPLFIPAAVGIEDAVQKEYVDTADIALSGRLTTLEGGVSNGLKIVEVTSDYTAAATEFVVVDATGGPVTVVLPSNPPLNTWNAVKKMDDGPNLVTVIGSGAATIDGDPDLKLAAPQTAMEAIYDGTQWFVSSVVVYDTGTQPDFTYRGDYDPATSYIFNDVVYYNGSSYIALIATTGVAPVDGTSTATWGLLALEGDPGATGPTGPPGPNTLAAADQITWATDTNLYRLAANSLATDDEFTVKGTLHVDAGIRYSLVKPTADYLILLTNRMILMNSATPTTVTLPSAVTAGSGAVFTIKNIAAGLVTMVSGGGVVDGGVGGPYTIAQWASRTFFSDGADWFTA